MGRLRLGIANGPRESSPEVALDRPIDTVRPRDATPTGASMAERGSTGDLALLQTPRGAAARPNGDTERYTRVAFQ
jgi:hypothetical protein